jgi:acyl-CoA reductase-like NAD-dependent aldehyde dehydrogenase
MHELILDSISMLAYRGSKIGRKDISMETYAHYIDGEWTPGSDHGPFDVRNPYDDSLYARAAAGTAPMGGVRDSGWGRHGKHAWEDLTDLIWVTVTRDQVELPI